MLESLSTAATLRISVGLIKRYLILSYLYCPELLPSSLQLTPKREITPLPTHSLTPSPSLSPSLPPSHLDSVSESETMANMLWNNWPLTPHYDSSSGRASVDLALMEETR